MTTFQRLTWSEAQRKSPADWREFTGNVAIEIPEPTIAANGLTEAMIGDAAEVWKSHGQFADSRVVKPDAACQPSGSRSLAANKNVLVIQLLKSA